MLARPRPDARMMYFILRDQLQFLFQQRPGTTRDQTCTTGDLPILSGVFSSRFSTSVSFPEILTHKSTINVARSKDKGKI